MADGKTLWERYCRYHYSDPGLGFSLDISRVRFDDSDLEAMAEPAARAIDAIQAIEGGAIANADENRMVGHYWLRDPGLAPTPQLADEIREDIEAVRSFAAKVHNGEVQGPNGPFRNVLHIGIGGSALGPQFIAQALGLGPNDRLKFFFFDNTDPEGFDSVFAAIGDDLDKTLITVVSKSGGTPEPANGMLEAKAACRARGLDFAKQAIAVTMPGSKLDKIAEGEGWLARFRMADWVGGRTSVWSPVGLVPAALQGIDIQGLLEGAAAMDKLGREPNFRKNPAALLALMWHKVGGGKGAKDMVILPYKDRLLLLSRYLQQLVMESLGKELDRNGAEVHQGIAVYGNKGSTDQHAYVQQLRDGVPNFFATFIQVLSDREGSSIEVEPGVTSGDYLFGFLQGTRRALFENKRDSVTIAVNEVCPRSVGALIALFERAVGIYAELVNINAYHQPGVEAGKKAAAVVLDLQKAVVTHLQAHGDPQTAQQIADAIGRSDEAETVYKILEHLAANPGKGVMMSLGDAPDSATFQS